MAEYDFKAIELKWQKIWEDTKYGQAEDFLDKPKHYNLIEFPYPSGAGLHVGHCMGQGASDVYCRMKRMQGYNVMFPIGWDAFGLPTENFAIKNKMAPQLVAAEAIATFTKQIKSLGYSFDWTREVNTTDPNYYKWTQWIFLQFYKHGIVDGKLIEIDDSDITTPRLAFQAEMSVNWCPSCKIVLANEEVIAGNCERCGAQSEKRKQKQWMLRITSYADRLIQDLDTVDYLDKIKTQQINWIGKSIGAEIDFKIVDSDIKIKVFTTRADTLYGCTYVVLAPEHPLVEELKLQITNIRDVEKYISDAKKKSDMERTELEKDKTGVKLEGLQAVNPINNENVDVYIADYCLASYGTGAVMAVPAHDKRDWDFAKKYNIEIKEVVTDEKKSISISEHAFTDYGVLINSDEFDGLDSMTAQTKITEKLKLDGAGYFAVNFKLRDWIFSRQHYWGEPIPIIHCKKCGTIPVPENVLPVTLPEVENYEPTDTGESPLAKMTDWVNVKCPKCGEVAQRETDTMPNWAGSSWYYLRYADSSNDGFFKKPTYFRPEIEWTDKDKNCFETFKKIYIDLDKLDIKVWASNRFLLNGLNKALWLPFRRIALMAFKNDEPQIKKYLLDQKFEIKENLKYGNLYTKDDIKLEIIEIHENQRKIFSHSAEGAEQAMTKNDLPESPLACLNGFCYRIVAPSYNLAHYKYINKNEAETREGLGDVDKIKFLEKYMDSVNTNVQYWMPVDLYNGGMEHTTLHLLYSRFWHKFLFDLGVVPGPEPYAKRIAHGIILGPDGQKMSKSKGNIINPDEMVEKFGADTLRAYIMFIGPYDQESAWNLNGIQGVHRFLKRVWSFFQTSTDEKDSDEILVKLNQTIEGVTNDINEYQMNTVVSKMMELLNTFEKAQKISKESKQAYLKLLFPTAPHIADELWEMSKFDGKIEDSSWPKVDEKYLISAEIEIAVQVNGKTRSIIKIASNSDQTEVEKTALTDEKVKNAIGDQNIVKTIYVTRRIVNFVVKLKS